MRPTSSPAARWRRAWYLQRVELWLDPMPRRRRRAVLAELRANLDAASADVGLEPALADLGTPGLLARHYLDAEPQPRPHWNQGAVAASLVLAAWAYATLFYAVGMLDALSFTGNTGAAEGSFLGTQVRAVANANEFSAAFSGVPWAPLTLALLTFLLVGRAWHVVGRRATAEVSAP